MRAFDIKIPLCSADGDLLRNGLWGVEAGKGMNGVEGGGVEGVESGGESVQDLFRPKVDGVEMPSARSWTLTRSDLQKRISRIRYSFEETSRHQTYLHAEGLPHSFGEDPASSIHQQRILLQPQDRSRSSRVRMTSDVGRRYQTRRPTLSIRVEAVTAEERGLGLEMPSLPNPVGRR